MDKGANHQDPITITPDIEKVHLRDDNDLEQVDEQIHGDTPFIDRRDSQSLNSQSQLGLHRSKSKTHYDGFSLGFEDLIVWMPPSKGLIFKREEKDILKGISSFIPKGSMTAIIGPSGSGKTTLMNFLAGRQQESQIFRSYCRYYINGSKVDNVNKFKNIIGYVLQDDIMEASLTPREILRYYARLRGVKQVEESVNDILDLMSLESCADTVVGDVFVRGLSGGERKRTSIAIELISSPNLLFLDEPTTGLDSVTAFDVMDNLASLKERGITIISTIHSPSIDILDLFDQVIMLVDGMLVFDGKPDKLADRMGTLGLEVPWDVEPIEYFMKVIDKDILKIKFAKEGRDIGPNGEILQKEHDERIKRMVEVQSEQTKIKSSKNKTGDDSIGNLQKLSKGKNQKLNTLTQFGLILGHSSKIFFRDFYGMLGQTMLFWFLTIMFILVFVDLGDIETDTVIAIQNRGGFAFILDINFFFIGTNLTSTLFIPRKQIFLKDKQSRFYDDGPFFLATQLYSMPLLIFNITISLVILYFALRLDNDPGTNYLWWWLFSFCGSYMGGGAFGMILGVIGEKIEHLAALVPAIVWPQLIVAGYLANVETMIWPLWIFSFTSPARYVFQGYILTEFGNRDKYINSCNVTTEDENGNKYVTAVPDDQKNQCDPLQVFNFNEDTKWLNLVIVLVINIGVRIVAFLFFKYKYRERNAVLYEDTNRIQKYTLKNDLDPK